MLQQLAIMMSFHLRSVFVLTLIAATFAREYKIHHFLDDGKYNLSLVKESDVLYFQAVVATKGWVGFGIASANYSMREMDCIVAGVKDGKGYINDFYANETARPILDKNASHYILESATEADGKTTIQFHRPRNLTNEQDFVFKHGKQVWLVWAYHDSIDGDKPLAFPRHTSRGYTTRSATVGSVDLTISKTTTTKTTPTLTSSKPTLHSQGTRARQSLPFTLLVITAVMFKLHN